MPRKTSGSHQGHDMRGQASMRPRHFASENFCAGAPAPVFVPTASMRPRHFASENFAEGDEHPRQLVASMRPRHFASENNWPGWAHIDAGSASMRPRHFASENQCLRPHGIGSGERFNEAEAFCLGKRNSYTKTHPLMFSFNEAEAFCLGKPVKEINDPGFFYASMRPRHFASENSTRQRRRYATKQLQ